MKTKEVVIKIKEAQKINKKIGFRGLKINIDGETSFYQSFEELIEAVEKVDTNNLYRFNVEVSEFMFLNVTVNVNYLTDKELGHPLNLVRIARNLEAVNSSNYELSDARNTYNFYSNLKKTLDNMMKKLSPQDIEIINQLTV